MSEAASALFGASGQVGVGRGLAEFRAGRPVAMTGGGETMIALPVEGLDAARLRAFRALCAPVAPRLAITGTRARALGLHSDVAVTLDVGAQSDVARVLALVAEPDAARGFSFAPASEAVAAAVELTKLAQILPSVLVATAAPAKVAAFDPALVAVDAAAVARFRDKNVRRLVIAGEAHVPLQSGTATRFVVFRDSFGTDSVAVVVGTPDLSKPVPVRIHSACLTGDVFGSRRCDCGDQLRLALAQLRDANGGIILYLPQEGRGLGLANKMRTYELQDGGLDTIDANTTLGFHDDERDYGVAVQMLQMLGATSVVLLTNNPAKLDGLARAGIGIAGRIPLEAPINTDNRRYMTAKAARAGHQFGHLLETLGEGPAEDGKGGKSAKPASRRLPSEILP